MEPVLITPDCYEAHKAERTAALNMVAAFTLARKTTWPTRDDARKYFESRLPWKLWDHNVLEAYVEHGLGCSNDAQSAYLKCGKEQEAAAYADARPHIDGATRLAEIRKKIPVHLILGQRDDSMCVSGTD